MKVALCFIISYEHILNKEEIWKNMGSIQIEFQKRIEEDKGSKVSIIEVIE